MSNWNEAYSGYQNPSTPFQGFMGLGNDDEFNRTLAKVSEEIGNMATTYATLSKMTKDLGTKKDTPQLRNQLCVPVSVFNSYARAQKIKATVATVNAIQTSLHKLEKLAGNSKERKERIKAITQKFDSFNHRVTEICATARERIEDVPVHISLDIDIPDMPPYPNPTFGQGNMYQQQQHQQFIELTEMAAIQDEEIAMKDKELRRLEGEMIEVNGIFKELAELVATSAPLVDTIEDNILTAHEHVKIGAAELREAEQQQKNSRRKVCWIAVGVALAVVFVLLIVVLSTRQGTVK